MMIMLIIIITEIGRVIEINRAIGGFNAQTIVFRTLPGTFWGKGLLTKVIIINPGLIS